MIVYRSKAESPYARREKLCSRRALLEATGSLLGHNPKHYQKVQPELISLASLLDLLLLPMITLPNCSWTPARTICPNHESTISKHKHTIFDHSQSHPLHLTLQLIPSTMLTKLIYLIYIIGISTLASKIVLSYKSFLTHLAGLPSDSPHTIPRSRCHLTYF
jgi:hypothetical protein